MWVRPGACHWSRRTSPQPFAPRGKGRPRCARPRVRPRPVLRAGGTTFGLPYGASLTLAPTLRRRSAALPQDGCICPALCAGSPIGGASRPGEPQRLTRRVRPTFPLRSCSVQTPCDWSCAEPWSGRAGRARGLARRAGAAGGGWRGGCAGGAARDDSIAPHPPRRRKPGVRRRNAPACRRPGRARGTDGRDQSPWKCGRFPETKGEAEAKAHGRRSGRG